MQSHRLSEDKIICGHVGVAGIITSKEERAFRTMLRLDVLRGEDSTGIASMTSGGIFKVAKDATNAYDFLNTKEAKEPFYGVLRVLLGHNRAATKGKVVAENAHPFTYGNIIGAHNGTLNYWGRLLDGSKFDVDSKAIFNHIAEEDVADLWSKLDGAAALVWMNKEEKTVNFLRNSKRELYYTTSTDGKCFFWASEPWMMYVACTREGIDIEKPVMFKENVHYTLTTEKEMNLSVRELEPYKPTYTYTTYSYPTTTNRGSASSESTGTTISKETLDTIQIHDLLKFKVDLIRDWTSAEGIRKSTVIGITAAGLPVRAFGVISDQYEWILNVMATEDLVFEGRILAKNSYQIEVDMATVFPIYDVDEAEGNGKKCYVCNCKIEEGKEHVQPSGKTFCEECQLDLDELENIGYV